jgi:hypothetical protein
MSRMIRRMTNKVLKVIGFVLVLAAPASNDDSLIRQAAPRMGLTVLV